MVVNVGWLPHSRARWTLVSPDAPNLWLWPMTDRNESASLSAKLRRIVSERPRPLLIKDRGAAEPRAAMRRVINSVVDLDRLSSSLPGLVAWYRDRRAYMELPGAERLDWRASDPQVHDLTPRSPFDPHYFFQDVWAAQRVAELAPQRHVDVGSRVDLVGFLTAITEVTFVDIRLLEAEVEGLSSVEGSVLEMPFADRSLESVSCLHVAEHIGLGRYGDPLDPNGTVKAMKELQRVVAPGGQLLFGGPVGRPQVVFNAHRIQPPSSVIGIFDELELIEFSGTDDSGHFSRHRSPDEFEDAGYALGLFLFRRPLAAA